MKPRCDYCGRFLGYQTCDEYTDFGSSADLEPPNPVCLCARCSRDTEERIVSETKRPSRPYMPWRPGRCHYRAIRRLGMVAAGERGRAWCEAFWPENIPDGYVVWNPKGDA